MNRLMIVLTGSLLATTAQYAHAEDKPTLTLERLPKVVAAVDDQQVALDSAPVAPERETTIFGLPKNIGPGERVIRAVVGAGLAGLGVYGLATDEFSTTTSAVVLGISALPLATAATGYCPLYQLIGVDYTF